MIRNSLVLALLMILLLSGCATQGVKDSHNKEAIGDGDGDLNVVTIYFRMLDDLTEPVGHK